MEHLFPILHTVLSFIAIISVIVFVHEFGHYFVARLCGVKVETFSIGFGKELFGFSDGHGTRWKFSILPLGGYVKMFGDASEASTPDAKKLEEMVPEEKAVAFHFKSLPKKAAVVVAGPMANFILTIVIFTAMIFTYGLTTTEPIVGAVVKGSPAEEAGVLAGDRVLRVDDTEIRYFNDIIRYLATNTGTPVAVEIQREEKTLILTMTPRLMDDKDIFDNPVKRLMIGLSSTKLTRREVGFFGAIGESFTHTYQLTAMNLEYMGQMIMGKRSAKELKGPLGIAKITGQATKQDASTVLSLMAMLSASLGLVNLFPIPPLDGGHLAFYALEGARGRPMAERFQEWSFRAGFAIIIMLMAFTIFNDVRQMI